MILVHFYRNMVIAPRITGPSAVASKASLQRLSLNLVKANFVVAPAVVFF